MAPDTDWRILKSTMLRAIAYDEDSRDLRVRFTSGAIYRYHEVPPEIATALVDPPEQSHGRYFNDHVRDAFDYDEEKR